MKNSYKFFENKDCEYYPCHNMNNINCLFCYCPLYSRHDCGKWINGIKDCSQCKIPHIPENYDYIIKKLTEKNKDL